MAVMMLLLKIISALTCDEVLERPVTKKLLYQELETMQSKEIIKCISHLGREPLEKQEAEFLWKSIVKVYGSSGSVPENILMQLHWITTAVTPNDYLNMTLSNIDVVQNFGLDYNLHQSQLEAIADRVREDFSGKQPEDYTYYDLIALRQILCAFNRSEIERIHPLAYKDAALMIGKLKHCDSEVMAGFVTLAIQDTAFGPSARWNEATREFIGVVANYAPNYLTKKDADDT